MDILGKLLFLNRSKGTGCPSCNGRITSDKNRLSILFPKIFMELNKEKNKNFNLYDLSYSSKKRVWWTCNKCKFEWETRVDIRTIRNKGCPSCNNSSGEKKILEFVEKINFIKYKPQFSFSDCKNINPLLFDFCIFDYKNEIKLMIEYNGEQHYKPIDFFGGIETFRKQVINDKIKIEYCKKNNIPLLIISYKEFNMIEEILKRKFNKIFEN